MRLIKGLLGVLLLMMAATLTLAILAHQTSFFQPLLINFIQQQTGNHLSINDEVRLSFGPNIKISFKNGNWYHPFAGIDVIQLKQSSIVFNWRNFLNSRIDPIHFSTIITIEPLYAKDILVNADLEVHQQIKLLSLQNLKASIGTNIKATGNITFDFVRQQANWDDFKLFINDDIFMGNLFFENIKKKPQIYGKIKLNVNDGLYFLRLLNANLAFQKIDNVSGAINFAFHKNQFLSEGQFFVKALEMNDLMASNLQGEFSYKNHQLIMAPLSLDMLSGNFSGKVLINENNKRFESIIEGVLSNFDSALLWKKFIKQSELNLAGIGTVALNLQSRASAFNELFTNMTGTGKFKIQNGYIQNNELAYWINPNHLRNIAAQNDRVMFLEMLGNANIKANQIITDDLFLETSELTVKGKGEINILHQKINVTLSTSLKNSTPQRIGNVIVAAPESVPINIKGSISKPTVSIAGKQ